MIQQTARPALELARIDLGSCQMVARMDDALDGQRIAPRAASDAAKTIVGCYRARDFVDVDTFVVALVATLAQHPEVVVRLAADPVNGIPRKYKFVPAISEIADELEAITTRIRLAAQGARRALAIAKTANH